MFLVAWMCHCHKQMNVISGSACWLRGQNRPAQTSCEHSAEAQCRVCVCLRAESFMETQTPPPKLYITWLYWLKHHFYCPSSNIYPLRWFRISNSDHFCYIYPIYIYYIMGYNIKISSFIVVLKSNRDDFGSLFAVNKDIILPGMGWKMNLFHCWLTYQGFTIWSSGEPSNLWGVWCSFVLICKCRMPVVRKQSRHQL